MSRPSSSGKQEPHPFQGALESQEDSEDDTYYSLCHSELKPEVSSSLTMILHPCSTINNNNTGNDAPTPTDIQLPQMNATRIVNADTYIGAEKYVENNTTVTAEKYTSNTMNFFVQHKPALHNTDTRLSSVLEEATLMQMNNLMDNMNLTTTSVRGHVAPDLPLQSQQERNDLDQKMFLLSKTTISISNCIDLFQLAGKLDLEELWNFTYSFIVNNFQKVSTDSPDFVKLTLEEFCLLLMSDSMNCQDIEIKFEAILIWNRIEYDVRTPKLPLLMRLVEIPRPCNREKEMDQASIQIFLEENESQRQDQVQRRLEERRRREEEEETQNRLFEEKRKEKILLREKWKLDVIKQIHRKQEHLPRPKEYLFLVGGYSEGKIEVLNEKRDKWLQQRHILSLNNHRTWSVPIGHSILVMEDVGRTVRSLDTISGHWTSRSPLPVPRDNFSISILDGLVYVIGGGDLRDPSAQCHSYNPEEDKWSEVASFKKARRLSSAVALEGKLYIAGGSGKNRKELSSVEVFDPVKNEWTETRSLSKPRVGLCLATCGTFVWSFGGFGKGVLLDDVERFHPTTGIWTKMAAMPSARCNLAVSFFGGQFYAVGGFSKDNVETNISEIFDPSRGTWVAGPHVDGAREFLNAFVLNTSLREDNH